MRKLNKAALSDILSAFTSDMLNAFDAEGMGSDDIDSIVGELNDRFQVAFSPMDEVAESIIYRNLRDGKYGWMNAAKGMRDIAGFNLMEGRRMYRKNFARVATDFMVHNVTTPEQRNIIHTEISYVTGN